MLAKVITGKKKIFHNYTEVERKNCYYTKRSGRGKITKKTTSKILLEVGILENKKS